MSFEVLDQLENKIKQAVETIQLLQLEVDELREKNGRVQQENDALRGENEQLRGEHQNIQERLRSLLGITDSI
ncbi:cell division protein ZapB [Aggregatibacter aphrophilus]|jgi:cell division protein zapB|uniref:cell division protein ZapB n=1 Tax=Aggregatibacter aphrophilus TaxID=732 RepID=UPI000D65B350|nr:cell division protein ZapB [Aggregatibacter aphrophilus]